MAKCSVTFFGELQDALGKKLKALDALNYYCFST